MERCTDSRFEKMLYAWELDMLSDEDRLAFQEHVLECPSCLRKLQQFEEASRILRHDPDLRVALDDLAAQEEQVAPRRSVAKEGVTRGRRSNLIRTVVAVAAVLVILVLRPWDITISPSKEAVAAANRLAVMYFDEIPTNSENGRMGEAVTNLLITDLSESQYVQVVSGQRLYDILKRLGHEDTRTIDRDLASRVAVAADVRWMLLGSIIQDSSRTIIASQIVDVSDGSVKASQKVTGGPSESIFDLVDKLTVAVKTDLALPTAALKERDPAVASVTTRSTEAYYAYLEGVDYLSKVYNREAVASFERALQYDSTFAMAYYQLARLKDRRLIAKAAKYADGASQREQYYIRAREASSRGDMQGFTRELRELLKRYPNEKEAMYLLGVQEYADYKFDESVRLLHRALEVDPLYKEALNQLCYAENARGDFEQALEAIDRYISIAPNEANPYDTRADLLASNGQLDAAIASYQKALEKKPDFTASRIKLGAMYVFNREYEPARREFDTLLAPGSKADRSTALLSLAYIPIHQGKFNDALAQLDTAIRAGRDTIGPHGFDQDRASYHYVKAQIYSELGQHQEAIGELREAAVVIRRAAPSSQFSYLCIAAREYAEMGELEAADSSMESITRGIDSMDSAPVTYKAYGRGLVALGAGKPEEAVKLLEKAIRNSSAEAYFGWRFNLATAYLEAGMAEKAINDLEELTKNYTYGRLSEGVFNVRMHYLLGRAYEQVGRYDDAEAQYGMFLSIWKDSDHESDEMKNARARLAQLRERSQLH